MMAQSPGVWERVTSSLSWEPMGPQAWLRVAARVLRSVNEYGVNLFRGGVGWGGWVGWQ